MCLVYEDDIGLFKGGDYVKVDVFLGCVDIYFDFVMVSVWNILRVFWLLLVVFSICLMVYCCFFIDYCMILGYCIFKSICEEIILEILVLVFYYFGWYMKYKDGLNISLGIFGFVCGDEGFFKVFFVFFVLWLLICVKNYDIIIEE